jgi:hypothetical protein
MSKTKLTHEHQIDFIPDKSILVDAKTNIKMEYDKQSRTVVWPINGSGGCTITQAIIDFDLHYIQGQDDFFIDERQ